MTPLPAINPTSVPIYSSPRLRTGAVHHIVVTQAAEAPAAFLEQLHEPVLLSALDGVVDDRLRAQLGQARVGTHLYLMGDEAFIWHLHGLATAAGLAADEIALVVPDAGERRVYCVHCAQTQRCGPAARVTCQHCDVVLGVREHFSRRQGAYIGVCDNPDQPYGSTAS
ncbi:dimethylamine monooxygenase subunit DmmA family protein [Pseudomonas sp. dw_358]|uniref:dimethylamine monooxygenase subunit DmmA family protein n=1 Tax=Pseudomonas sp. dw_358 TaxID=2720083 RepID=UPI001BD4A276|nr:dimethylamine monooxygenase subunit DmmA family protein [Pseudomonas sp. dw_358]